MTALASYPFHADEPAPPFDGTYVVQHDDEHAFVLDFGGIQIPLRVEFDVYEDPRTDGEFRFSRTATVTDPERGMSQEVFTARVHTPDRECLAGLLQAEFCTWLTSRETDVVEWALEQKEMRA